MGGGDALGATAFAPQPMTQQAPAQQRIATQLLGQQAAGMAPPKADRRGLVGFLVSYQDDPLGRFWPLYQGRNSIGRAETGQDVDVPIGHGTTSTRHAQLDCDNGRVIVSDLGSTNGTFHNEEAIGFQGRREVRDGDKLRFGGFTVVVINVVGRA
jgi:pSer/pThr/pTyr-binding forkhead associated (FHA) protein